MIPDEDLLAHHLDKAKEELVKASALVQPMTRRDGYIGAALLAVDAAKKEPA
jgi:hypothetical protein